MNRSKEGETGRSECEVTKSRCLEAEELREIWDLSWKSSLQNKLGPVVCIILTSVLRRSLLTSLAFFFFSSGAQFRSIQLSLVAAPSSWLPHSAQLFSLIRKGLFFKADTAVCIQNDLFSASLSKLKIVCYIAMSPVATGLHCLPTHALSHDS